MLAFPAPCGDRALTNKTTITVRDIDPGDKTWLQTEAAQRGLSMEAFVRQLIHEKRERARWRERPSEVFAHFFGLQHGVDLEKREALGLKPRVDFSGPEYDRNGNGGS